MSSLAFKNTLERIVLEFEAVENEVTVPFYVTATPKTINYNCPFIRWANFKDSPNFDKEHPHCSHEQMVREYSRSKTKPVNCVDCPHYPD